MIGPNWLTRLTHPKRWKHLDNLMDVSHKALAEVARWQEHAETATGERLYLANLAHALAGQIFDDASQAWCAIYGNRWEEAGEHTTKCRVHSEQMAEAAREFYGVPAEVAV